jgi:Tfp pilus assembly protein PilO
VSRLNRHHLWLLGGVLGATLLFVVTYFFIVGPQREETSSLRDQAAQSEEQFASLQRRIRTLRDQNDELTRYKQELEKARQALPTTPSMSDLLRELQVAGDETGVAVGSLTIGNAVEVVGISSVYALPLSLSVTGTVPKLNAFLDQLQKIQPRALLVSTAVLTGGDNSGSDKKATTLALTMQAFVAPPAGTGVPNTKTTSAATPSAGTG